MILQDSSGKPYAGSPEKNAPARTGEAQATEDSTMRQLLLVLLGRIRRGAPHVLGSGLPLVSLALVVVGCAGPSLMPKAQAAAIKDRDRALASHADAIQAAIRQSGNVGALAFLDANDGRLIVLPGDSPPDAWARYATSPESGTGRVSVPAVVIFVHRADVPKAPEAVTQSALQQHEALRTSVTALETELRDAYRRTEERLGLVQRELAESIAATKQETDGSLAAARADMQKALSSLAEDLAAARKFMLQTAQLGWLNDELNVENARAIRKVAAASQELTASSARLEDTMRQLSDSLASQLKELASRLDTIQGKVSNLK
jgi:roadblock/LC7 domain-containing protein